MPQWWQSQLSSLGMIFPCRPDEKPGELGMDPRGPAASVSGPFDTCRKTIRKAESQVNVVQGFKSVSPGHLSAVDHERMPQETRAAKLQGSYFLATGLWPLLSRRTFEMVTGPKADFWLAQTVGVLVATVGGTLVLAERRKRLTHELMFLGVTTAAGLGCVDVFFVLRGRIPKVYLADAAVEAMLVAEWIRRA
jgi:hypothetical protein